MKKITLATSLLLLFQAEAFAMGAKLEYNYGFPVDNTKNTNSSRLVAYAKAPILPGLRLGYYSADTLIEPEATLNGTTDTKSSLSSTDAILYYGLPIPFIMEVKAGFGVHNLDTDISGITDLSPAGYLALDYGFMPVIGIEADLVYAGNSDYKSTDLRVAAYYDFKLPLTTLKALAGYEYKKYDWSDSNTSSDLSAYFLGVSAEVSVL